MEYLKEWAFWNKDSIIADGILQEMDTLSPIDITQNNDTYIFNLKKFNISVKWDIGFVTNSYIVKIDDIKIDCSWNQGRKIWYKAKKIHEQDRDQTEELIKKDAKIAFRKK